jgi:hypothetical protein
VPLLGESSSENQSVTSGEKRNYIMKDIEEMLLFPPGKDKRDFLRADGILVQARNDRNVQGFS